MNDKRTADELQIAGWTDYPRLDLGDQGGAIAPIRPIIVIGYDGDKYARVRFEDGAEMEIKRGYCYSMPGRLGDVPTINIAEPQS